MNIRHFSTSRIVLGAIATVFSCATLAQEQGAELEEVVVTGSYLYTGIDSPSPVEVLSGEDMVAFAPPDLASFFFDNVPQNYSSEVGSQTQNQGQRRARSIRNAAINLRGLGDENSLVVLNGRRTIYYPVADGTGWYRTDINSIVPRIALQRTELLLDGGSAIFGSDPVAGVANFVTRNNFRGFDLNVDTRMIEEATDAKNVTFSALWGAGDNNTNLIAAIEFHQEDLIELIDIDPTYSEIPDVTPNGTGLEPQSHLEYGTSMGRSTWVDPDCANPAFGTPIRAHWLAYDDPGGDVLEAADYASADQCARPDSFDKAGTLMNNNVQQLIAFIHAEHSFSDSLRVNAEINYSRQRFGDIDEWGDNGSSSWSPKPNSYGDTYSIPSGHPGLVRARTLQPSFGTSMGMSAPVFQTGETLPFLSELPAFNENDLFRAAFGVEGDFNANWSWMVDTSAAYSEVRNGVRDILLSRYPKAISGLGGADCAQETGVAGMGNCFFYNPFMSSALPDAASLQTDLSQTGLANDPGMIEWLIPLRVDDFLGEFFHFDARITGQFGDLPGGPIGLAAGIAYREEYVERDADTLANGGEFATLGVFNDFSGKQQVDSTYFELALPVHEDINIQIAGRQEKYKGGFSEFSPKIAALWTPTDRLTVRGSWGTSFKGPSISHASAATIFSGMGPPRLTVQGTTYGRSGGGPTFTYETTPNPDILPQTSDNLSFGADFVLTDRIDIGGNFVQIEFKDLITAQTANNVLSNCVVKDANGIPITETGSAMSSLMYPLNPDGTCVKAAIDNSPTEVFDVNGDGILDTYTDNIGTLANRPSNIGFLNAQFFDLHANMRFDTPIGALTFSPNVTFTLQYDFPVGGAAGRDGLCPPPEGICSSIGRSLGMGFNGVTNMPHWQGSFPVTLNLNNNRFRMIARYRDSLNKQVEDLSDNASHSFVHEEGMWTLDFNWAYEFNQGSSIAVSVNNMFATDPPDQGGSRFNRRRREFGLQFRHSFDN